MPSRSTSVLVSRLILNLRVVASYSDVYASTEMLYTTWIPQNQVMRSVVGNIGNDFEGLRFRAPQSDESAVTARGLAV